MEPVPQRNTPNKDEPFHSSKLPALPPAIDLKEYFFTLSYKFGPTADTSHMALEVSDPEWSRSLLDFWSGFREEGARYLEGHPAFFALAIPWPNDKERPARLQVAVPFIDTEDLTKGHGTENALDFDRLMDVVKQILLDMLESKLLQPGNHAVELIIEPLSHEGAPCFDRLKFASFAIGATWLEQGGQRFFTSYRYWDPEKRRWIAGE